MSSCCTLEKNNNLLILLVDLEKKGEQPRMLNDYFRFFFENGLLRNFEEKLKLRFGKRIKNNTN